MNTTTKRMIPKWMIKKLHVLYARYGLSEEQYRALILELTDGRTDTTKELTYAESQYLSGYITGANTTIKPVAERLIEKSLKWQRSAVLKRLQQIGVDTSSWDAVNAYLRSLASPGSLFTNWTAKSCPHLSRNLNL